MYVCMFVSGVSFPEADFGNPHFQLEREEQIKKREKEKVNIRNKKSCLLLTMDDHHHCETGGKKKLKMRGIH